MGVSTWWPVFEEARSRVGWSQGIDFRPLQVGDRAPVYGARSLAGDSVDFTDLEGHPLLVNLWATCPRARWF